MNPDEIMVDTWLQLAVIRVFEPWQNHETPLPEHENAKDLVENARHVLSRRNVQVPPSPPTPYTGYHPPEDRS